MRFVAITLAADPRDTDFNLNADKHTNNSYFILLPRYCSCIRAGDDISVFDVNIETENYNAKSVKASTEVGYYVSSITCVVRENCPL